MQRYIVTTVAGREQSVNATSAEAARLLRLDQMLDVLIEAEKKAEPRRFDWHALPREVREDHSVAVAVSDLYRED